uniref:FBD domain-containing protein n=1 Tax=Aegilops tauschii subsp. strangulata TaxID=200361 RepID=A0A453D441_AEGTS
TVESAHLRSFAMICCHHASRVKLHSSCLQSLHYKGGIPLESLFKVANYKGVMALTIEICEDLSKRKSTEVAPVTGLISQCTELAYLHLSLRPSMAYHSSLFADAVRGLPLRQSGLKGCLREGHAARSVAVLLRETKNLEVLSLFPLGQPQKKESWMSDGESGTEIEDDGDDEVDRSGRATDSLWQMYIRCLGHKLRRISIVNYKGLQLERMLAHFLLDRGKTLEEFSVTSPVESSRRKHQMACLLRSWRRNRHTRVTVN